MWALGLVPLLVLSPSASLQAELERAALLVQRGAYGEAAALSRDLLERARQVGDGRAEGQARLRLADVHFYQGALSAYGSECELALAAFERAGDGPGAALALYYLAYVHERRDPRRMLAVLEQALARAGPAAEPALEMKLRNALGTAAWELGRYREALEHFERAAGLAGREGRENNRAVALTNMGMVEVQRGRPEAGLARLAEAVPLLEKHGNRLVAANALGVASQARRTLGDVEDAQGLSQRALAAYRELGNLRGQATQISVLSELAAETGDLARAQRLQQDVLGLAAELGDERRSVQTLLDIAALRLQQGRPEEARAPALEALERALRLGDPQVVAVAERTLADRAVSLGDERSALDLLHRALVRLAGVGDGLGQGLVLGRLARLHAAGGRPRDARAALERAVKLHRAAHAPQELPAWEAWLGDLAAGAGDEAAARRHFAQALVDVEDLDRRLTLERFRWRLFSQAGDAFRRYAAFLAARGELAEAWAVLDLGRARDLRARLRASAAREPGEAERDALARVSEVQRQLAEAAGRAERQRLGAALEEAEAAYDAARRDAAGGAPAAPPRRALRLPAGLVVQFARLGDELLVFSSRDGRLAWRRVPRAAELEQRARRFRQQAADATRAFPLAEARALHEVLLEPETRGAGGARLTLVPEGELALLPFAALIGPDQRWLVERLTLSQVPALGLLTELGPRPAARPWRGLLAVASTRFADAGPSRPDLPAAARETQALERRRPARVLVDPGEDAVKRLPFAEFELAHFASHALVDEARPERSAILLAPAAGEDGLLQAREIDRLRLPLGLVVVSSCRSAGGALVGGEGLVGLSHAFLAAGARAVLGAQWDVSDEGSAELMEAFYAELERRPVAEALARAQRGMAGGRFAHPAHWAGYVVTGDADQLLPVPRPAPTTGTVLALALAALLATWGLARLALSGGRSPRRSGDPSAGPET